MACLHANLEWVSFEMRSRRTGAVTIVDQAMLWSEEPCEPFCLSPEQLVPTSVGAGTSQTDAQGRFDINACTFN